MLGKLLFYCMGKLLLGKLLLGEIVVGEIAFEEVVSGKTGEVALGK